MTEKVAIFVETPADRHLARLLAERLGTTRPGLDAVVVEADAVNDPAGWPAAEAVDRLVIFDDRSARGSRLVAAARGLPIVLVQSRQLDFQRRSSAPAARDRVWGFGDSGVSVIAVWGPTSERAIAQRDARPTPTIVVTGALGISDAPDFAARADLDEPHRRDRTGGLRVLVADQALEDDFGIAQAVHRRVLGNVAKAMAEPDDLTVAADPRSAAGHRAWLGKTFPGKVLDELPGHADLTAFDVVVSLTSSAYAHAVAAGVPVIIYGAPDLEVVVPRLRHPLVSNVTPLATLRRILTEYRETGEFSANRAGARIRDEVLVNPQVLDDVTHVILHAQPTVSEAPSGRPDRPVGTLDEPAGRLDLPAGSLAIVGDNFSSSTGMAVPLMAVVDSLTPREQERVRLTDVRAFDRANDLTRELSRSRVIVVNSLGPFWRSAPLLDSMKALLAGGDHVVVVYAHVTGWVIDRKREAIPERHAALLELFPKLHFWCVSDRQADLLKSLGARSTTTVLNTTFGLPARVEAGRQDQGPDAGRKLVVMAGTVQERKGPALFGAVADLAAERGLPYDFVWVGRDLPHLRVGIELSANVDWRGQVERSQLQEILHRADVFLLSSQDDPMPLVTLEAVAAGTRVVSYDQVGTFEALDGVSGYVAYEAYEAEAALAAATKAMEAPVDLPGYQRVLDSFSVEALRSRMAASLVTLDPVSLEDAVTAAQRSGDEEALLRTLTLAADSDHASEDYWLTLSRLVLRVPSSMRPIGVAAAQRALELNPGSRAARRLLRRHGRLPALARQATSRVRHPRRRSRGGAEHV